MTVRFHRNFEKYYKKLTKGQQTRAKQRLALFLNDEFDPILNNHPIRGRYKGYRSINITGDLRGIYKRISASLCIFIIIDTHSNLYK